MANKQTPGFAQVCEESLKKLKKGIKLIRTPYIFIEWLLLRRYPKNHILRDTYELGFGCYWRIRQ